MFTKPSYAAGMTKANAVHGAGFVSDLQVVGCGRRSMNAVDVQATVNVSLAKVTAEASASRNASCVLFGGVCSPCLLTMDSMSANFCC